MALDTTPGSATQNSFATVAEFKTYRGNRLPSIAAVLAANDTAIEAALIVAGRSLDANFDWTGAAVDDVQAMTWPRSGMLTRNGFAIGTTTIPQPLKDAQCELAYQLLGGADLVSDNAAAAAGVASVKAGSVSVAFQEVDTSSVESVDMMLRRLGSEFNYLSVAIPGEVRRLLVPSWYNQPSIVRPFIFDALP